MENFILRDIAKKVYLYIFVITVLTSMLGFLFENKIILLCLNLCVMPAFFISLMHFNYWDSLKHVLFWAILQTLVVMYLTYLFTQRADKIIFYAAEYYTTHKQFAQLQPGPNLIIRRWDLFLLIEYPVFLLVNFFSFGLATLVWGCFALNYMGYAVVKFLQDTGSFSSIFGLSWTIWDIFRAIGLILGSLSVSKLAISFWLGSWLKPGYENFHPFRYILFGFAFTLSALFLKFLLLPQWSASWRPFLN